MDNNFSWENTKEKYDIDTSKKKLPEFYDFYDVAQDFINVYEPAEDTFLLIDSMELELKNMQNFFNDIKNKNKELNTIEIGCGNGLISCCFLSEIKKYDIKINHYCVDINKDAINLTHKLLEKYNFDKNTKFIEGDLFNKIDKNILFDIIIFNPPYVTTDDEEYKKALNEKNIYAAWAGGKKGSETINNFVEQLKNRISENCVIFLLLSKENDYNFIINNIINNNNMKYDLLMKKRFKNEKLAVFKFYNN